MDLRSHELGASSRTVACATLVLTPALAFEVFPVPGIVLLVLILPALVLGAAYAATSGNRIPGWELLLVGLLALSVLWGDDPNYSTERLRTYLPLVLVTVLASSILSGETVMRCLKGSFALIIGASLLSILVDPAGAGRAGSEEFILTAQFSKNTYGGLLVMALLLVLDTKRRSTWILAPGLIVMLALNRTVTAWVVAFILVLAALASQRAVARLRPSTSGPVLAALAAAAVGGAMLLSQLNLTSALASVGKDPTLGRRTEIWAASWSQIQEAPLLGHGAFTFLDTASRSPVTQLVWARFQGYQPPHPHNGLLDLAGQIGLVGVIVFAAMLLRALRLGAQQAVAGVSSSRTAVLGLMFILLFGAAEPTYLGPWLVVTVMLTAVADPRTGSGQAIGRLRAGRDPATETPTSVPVRFPA